MHKYTQTLTTTNTQHTNTNTASIHNATWDTGGSCRRRSGRCRAYPCTFRARPPLSTSPSQPRTPPSPPWYRPHPGKGQKLGELLHHRGAPKGLQGQPLLTEPGRTLLGRLLFPLLTQPDVASQRRGKGLCEAVAGFALEARFPVSCRSAEAVGIDATVLGVEPLAKTTLDKRNLVRGGGGSRRQGHPARQRHRPRCGASRRLRMCRCEASRRGEEGGRRLRGGGAGSRRHERWRGRGGWLAAAHRRPCEALLRNRLS